MKKIEFGYSNSSNPTGSWEGIGISNDLLIQEAEYFGALSYEGNTYIFAKNIVDDDISPNNTDSFMVRDALVDMFADGSGIIMLNQEKSFVSQQFEEYLNKAEIKARVKSIDDIMNLVRGLGHPPKSFKIMEMDYENNSMLATSLAPEVFEKKNEAIKNCQSSFSDIQMQLEKQFSK